jgi:hypothetical protein
MTWQAFSIWLCPAVMRELLQLAGMLATSSTHDVPVLALSSTHDVPVLATSSTAYCTGARHDLHYVVHLCSPCHPPYSVNVLAMSFYGRGEHHRPGPCRCSTDPPAPPLPTPSPPRTRSLPPPVAACSAARSSSSAGTERALFPSCDDRDKHYLPWRVFSPVHHM